MIAKGFIHYSQRSTYRYFL